jgi:hypothetical protein
MPGVLVVQNGNDGIAPASVVARRFVGCVSEFEFEVETLFVQSQYPVAGFNSQTENLEFS